MANAYKTNYFDPMGKSHTGYIIDGKTYKDPQGKQRVEQGSVVETADGYYTLTKSGGVKTDLKKPQFENTKKEIKALKDNMKSQHEAAYSANKAEINAQKNRLKREFNKNAQNEYLKAMESEKNMDQLLKLQGLTGGMSESRKIQNKLSYENTVNDLREQLNYELSDLDKELLKLRNETDYNIAEDMAEYDKLYLSYMTKYQDDFSDWLRAEDERNADNFRSMYISEKEDERFREEMELDKEKFAHEVMDDERNYNLNVRKANKPSGNTDTEYKRRLEEAELRAKFGDFTLMAEIYGWDGATLEKANKNFKIRGN